MGMIANSKQLACRSGLRYTASSVMKHTLLRLFPILALLVLFGCSQAPPAAPVKQYQVTGDVLSVDPVAQTASLKAGKIEGWMEAMTMDFPVKDKQEFQKLKAGTTIRATVSVQGTEYWLSGITEVPRVAAPPTK